MLGTILKNYMWLYLLIINVISFLLFLIDLIRHERTGETIEPTWIFMFVTAIGGALGTNVYFRLFYPKFIKGRRSRYEDKAEQDYYNYWRIFAAVMLVIQVVVVLFVLEISFSELGSIINLFFVSIKQKSIANRLFPLYVMGVYLLIINIITFLLFVIDKRKARKNEWRIKEMKLYAYSFFGGSIGALLAMYIVHHKTKKQSFVLGIRLMLIMQMVIIIFILYKFGTLQVLFEELERRISELKIL